MKRLLVILAVLAAAAYLGSRATHCTDGLGQTLASLAGQPPDTASDSAISAKAAPAGPHAVPDGERFPGGQRCSVHEIAASSSSQGSQPTVDRRLEPVRDKLVRPPFTSWNTFEELDRFQIVSSSDRAELSSGAIVTLALVEQRQDASFLDIQVAAGDKALVSARSWLRYGEAFFVVTNSEDDNSRFLWLHCVLDDDPGE